MKATVVGGRRGRSFHLWYGVVRQGMIRIWQHLMTVRWTSASVSSSRTQVR